MTRKFWRNLQILLKKKSKAEKILLRKGKAFKSSINLWESLKKLKKMKPFTKECSLNMANIRKIRKSISPNLLNL